MAGDYCEHDMIRDYCADCRPTPVGLPDRVVVFPHGRLFHKSQDCSLFVNARRDALNPSTPHMVKPAEAQVTGYEAC